MSSTEGGGGKLVELMVRRTCGSCARVHAQIAPVVERGLAAEFGDRVPVVVIDGEEFACWEVDNGELALALL